MTIVGFPGDVGTATRRKLLRLFSAPDAVLDKLIGNKSDPSLPLVYRGWFGLRKDRASYFEGIEIGPDVAHGESARGSIDPLSGPTPMPSEADLPGWRSAVRDYYLRMEKISDALIHAMARGLGIGEDGFALHFAGGMSGLRLLRYPVRPHGSKPDIPEEQLYVEHEGVKREIISEPHVDFGFMTLLTQDEVGDLQVHMPDGTWIDVPPHEGQVVVNFGKLLERWTSGRIRATEHRVLSPGRERFSLPFFYEPHVDAMIAPLPLANSEQFVPFVYGDHVWASLPRLRRLFGERRNASQ